MNNNNNFVNTNSIKGNLIFIFLTLVAVSLLITGIIYLVKLAQSCLTRTGYYESFTNPVESRLQEVKRMNQLLDESIDIFNSNVQDACEIYAQVEEVYVGNNSGPNTQEEYGLPQDELNRRLERRKHAAKKRFIEARTMYGASTNTPVYECFSDQTRDELLDEVTDLEMKIKNIESSTVGRKGEELNSLLKFNNRYIKKSLQQMGNERARVIEGFNDTLLARADAALAKAYVIYDFIMKQKKDVDTQTELANEMTKTVSRLQNGDISSF